MVKVLMDEGAGGVHDITGSEDGCRAAEYVARARKLGLTDIEIEEDVGGYETSGGNAFDGLIRWACGAVFEETDTLVLFAPD